MNVDHLGTKLEGTNNCPTFIPNLINQAAHEIRNIPERTWNDIIIQVRQVNSGQRNVVWPKLTLELFNNSQNAFAALLRDFYVPAMEWAGIEDRLIIAMKDFLGKDNRAFLAASYLIIERKIEAAYEAFHKSGIPHLTASALSYYFHAVCLNSANPDMALLFDDQVVKALRGCQTADSQKHLLFDQNAWRKYLIENRIVSDPVDITIAWNVDGYMTYLRMLNSWADALGCRPVQIQIWLSNNSKDLWDLRDSEVDAKDHGTIRDILNI